MYNIFKHSDGSLVAIVEKPNYIRRHSNGHNVLCDARKAQGIACNGKAYNLIGREPISEGYETVVVSERDGGAMIQQQQLVNSIAFVTMAERGDIDDTTAGEHIDQFAEWAEGAEYREGSLRQVGRKLYRCKQGHTGEKDHAPGKDEKYWVCIADPRNKWPDWSQPVGAHDGFEMGDTTKKNGKRWRSKKSNNHSVPGMDDSWEEVPETVVLDEDDE